MTNKRCPECHGWGFTNQAAPAGQNEIRFDPPVMVICQAPFKNGVCTPHTNFRPFEKVYGDDSLTKGAVRLPSDKRRETREANAAKAATGEKKGGFGART